MSDCLLCSNWIFLTFGSLLFKMQIKRAPLKDNSSLLFFFVEVFLRLFFAERFRKGGCHSDWCNPFPFFETRLAVSFWREQQKLTPMIWSRDGDGARPLPWVSVNMSSDSTTQPIFTKAKYFSGLRHHRQGEGIAGVGRTFFSRRLQEVIHWKCLERERKDGKCFCAKSTWCIYNLPLRGKFSSILLFQQWRYQFSLRLSS